MNAKLFALIMAPTVYFTLRALGRRWASREEIDNPSPTLAGRGIAWLKAQFARGVDTEPDTAQELPDDGRRYYQLIDVDGHHTRVEWLNDPTPYREDDVEDDDAAAWINREEAAGAGYMDVVRRGQARYDVSDPTMRRWIREARAARKGNR